MIKLSKAEAPDPYTILQGKRDKCLDKILASMLASNLTQEQLWITNGGRYTIKPFTPQETPYVRYGEYMLIGTIK